MLIRIPSRFFQALTFLLIAPLLAVRSADSSAEDKVKASEAKQRTFIFTYSAVVTGLTPGKTARIWIPVPPTNEDQETKIISKELPGTEQIGTDPKFGNQILYVEGKADNQGNVPLSVTFRVNRKEVRGDFHKQPADVDVLESFLKPDKKVPVGGKSLLEHLKILEHQCISLGLRNRFGSPGAPLLRRLEHAQQEVVHSPSPELMVLLSNEQAVP